MSEIHKCPKCGATPFDQFLPFMVYRSGFIPWLRCLFLGHTEWAVICRACKEIIGYE